MQFEVLGPVRVAVDDVALPLGPPQQQKVLALLLAAPNQVVSTDRLIDEIWTNEPPPSARHLVQDYVWRLRNLLGQAGETSRIISEGPGYLIRVDPEELDARKLGWAQEEAERLAVNDVAAAERVLCEATGMWRGTPFGELSDECPTLRSEAVRLEELHLRAVADRNDAHIELGRHRELVGELEQLTHRHPYMERFWEQRMLALYRSDRQAEALRVYQELRRILGDELGIEPGTGAQELEGRILLHDDELLWEPLAPPSNLPIRLTSFVGRTSEIAEVAKLLDVARLVTLTGPGGVGKTRLAIEAADQVIFRYPDGVWWIDLAPLADPEMVVAAFAEALGVAAQPGTSLLEGVTRSLIRREALLVVDNCEHLAPTVADVVTSILLGAGRVRVLATSRAPLHVSGESLWTVPALTMPLTEEPDITDLHPADAVRLFAERGSAVDRSFALSEENADVVVEICRRLDGMPLAIEMAAARLRVLAPIQIAASLDDRFALLTRVEHATVARHESLQAAFDWSYQMLEPGVRHVFDRLSVFAGAFDLGAADAIARWDNRTLPILDAITALVDASMVMTVGSQTTSVRYRLLETLREFGARRLRERGEEEHARTAHADYFVSLAVRAGESIGVPAFADWIERIQDSYSDLRAALDWSLERAAGTATLQAAPTLFHYWYRTGDAREAGLWGRRMLSVAEAAPAAPAAAAHLALAFSSNILGDPEQAHANSAAAIRRYREADDRRGLVTALFGAANVALQVGDLDSARAHSRQAVTICDELGDRWSRAGPLATLSFATVFGGGSLDDAHQLADEALALYRELDDIFGQVVMNPLSVISMRQGDLDAAERFATDAATVAVGTAWEGTALVNLAEVRSVRGDQIGAEATLRRALIRTLDAGVEIWFRIALRDLARIAAARGDAHLAALLIGASRRNAHHYGLDPVVYEAVETRCRQTLDNDAFSRLTEEGYAMPHQQLLDLVLP